MKAELLLRTKTVDEKGNIVEVKIWKVEETKSEPYGIKYSLVYVENGKRIIGYDNYEKKGNHKHYLDIEMPYKFESVDKLIKDFLDDIEKYKKGRRNYENKKH